MLTAIRLSQFKSFAEEVVSFGPLTLLVGESGAGKSNLIEALRFLQGTGVGLKLSEILDGGGAYGYARWPGLRGGRRGVAHRGGEGFELETAWSIGDSGLNYRISCALTEGVHIARESLQRSDRLRPLFVTEGAPVRGPSTDEEGPLIDVLLQGADTIEPPVQIHSAVRSLLPQLRPEPSIAPELRGARALLLNALQDICSLDLRPEHIREPARSQPGLDHQGEGLSAAACALCEDPGEEAALIEALEGLYAPRILGLEFVEVAGELRLALAEAGGHRTPLEQLPDGLLYFLGMWITLRTLPEDALLLVEDIEGCLNPAPAQQLLQAAERTTRERGLQLIATTRSPAVLQALSEEALRDAVLVARPAGSETSALRRFQDLPDFEVMVKQPGVDKMFASGWLEAL